MAPTAPVRWQADRTAHRHDEPWPLPTLSTALLRGIRARCPACGKARLFDGYLRVTTTCPHCSAPLGLARADDVPPYFTILIVGHIIVPGMLLLERFAAPPAWVHAAIWLPLTLALSLLLLRPVKGATVGVMLSLGMVKRDSDE